MQMQMSEDQFVLNAEAAMFLNRQPDERTQPKKIISLLSTYRGTWVCGTAFLMAYLPTYSQRIGELIRKDLRPIERRPCADPMHNHDSSVGSYRWITQN